MTIEVTVSIKANKGTPKVYQFTQTAEAVKNKKGTMSLAHFQPTAENKVVKPFSKLYIDTAELKGK